VKAWIGYCDKLHINFRGSGLSSDDLIFLIQGFICHEVVIRGLHPDTIGKSYLGHVVTAASIYGWNALFKNARFSDRVTLTLRGLKRVYHKIHPICGSRRLAFTLVMSEKIDDVLGPPRNGIDSIIRRVEKLAINMGIFCFVTVI